MKFGVVLCPRCQTVRGTRLNAKTSTCARCGKRIDLKKARILCKVDTEKELASAVMEYGTKLKGGEDICAEDIGIVKEKKSQPHMILDESSDVYAQVVKNVIRIKGRDGKVVAVAKELCHCLEEFTEEDFYEILKRIGLEKGEECRKYIDKLIAENVIYEPKNGVYRCL